MKGKGLIIGLRLTMKKFFGKKITQRFPEVKPNLPERSHGSFDFKSEKCTACNMCALSCPNAVIKVESSKNTEGKKVLDNYNMNLDACLFCGLCVEACPTGALNKSSEFCNSKANRNDLKKSWKGKTGEKVDESGETEK